MKRGATISKCGRYRFKLWRTWAPGPTACFIMLNPSTADAKEDDPTIRRCIDFAQQYSCGTLVVVNLYAYRSTDPKLLPKRPIAIGPGNAATVIKEANRAAITIAAWGASKKAQEVAPSYVSRLPELYCLRKTEDGHPAHPLYLPKNSQLIAY